MKKETLNGILYAARESRVYAKSSTTRNKCPYITIHAAGGWLSLVPAKRRLSGNDTLHVYLNYTDNKGVVASEYEGEYALETILRFIHGLGRMRGRDLPQMWLKVAKETNVRCNFHARSVFMALVDGTGHRVSDVQVVQLRDDGWWYLTSEVEART